MFIRNKLLLLGAFYFTCYGNWILHKLDTHIRPFKKVSWPLWNICVTNNHGYVSLVVSTSRSFPHSWLITGFVTGLTRRVSLVELELLTLLEHMSSPPVYSGFRVTRSLILYVCFVDRCFSFFFWSLCCLFFFDLWILITPLVSSSSHSTSGRFFRSMCKTAQWRCYDIFLSIRVPSGITQWIEGQNESECVLKK